MAKKSNTDIQSLALRAAAERIAMSEGRAWKDVPPQEREGLKQAAEGKVNDADRERAVLLLARKMARDDGQEWKQLSKEQRQSFLAKAKSAA